MPYEIRAEDDVFNVYEDDEFLGILSCPYEQTQEEFLEEMNQAGFIVINRDEVINIGDFQDVAELQQWEVFGIDPGDDDFEDEEEEEGT